MKLEKIVETIIKEASKQVSNWKHEKFEKKTKPKQVKHPK